MPSYCMSLKFSKCFFENLIDHYKFPIESTLISDRVVSDITEIPVIESIPQISDLWIIGILYDDSRYEKLYKLVVPQTGGIIWLDKDSSKKSNLGSVQSIEDINRLPISLYVNSSLFDPSIAETIEFQEHMKEEYRKESDIVCVANQFKQGFADYLIIAYRNRENIKNYTFGLDKNTTDELIYLLTEIKYKDKNMFEFNINDLSRELFPADHLSSSTFPDIDPAAEWLHSEEILKKIILENIQRFSRLEHDSDSKSLFGKIWKAITKILEVCLKIKNTDIEHLLIRVYRPDSMSINNGKIIFNDIACRVDARLNIHYSIGNVGSSSLVNSHIHISKSDIHCSIDVSARPYERARRIYLKPSVEMMKLIISITIEKFRVDIPIDVVSLFSLTINKIDEIKIMELDKYQIALPKSTEDLSIGHANIIAEDDSIIVNLEVV